ncbi:hypothetical protein FRX31_004895, partial [Thalictrum thalictroides]
MCKIHHHEDYERVDAGQPWHIMGCILLIEPYTSQMNSAAVVFNRIPLWICFKGLLLEHLVKTTISMIAADAGEVIDVQPENDHPTSADDFRARIWVDINKPLLKGTFVNTIHQGWLWIPIKYINPPHLTCKLCMYLGHDYRSCTTTQERKIQAEKNNEKEAANKHKAESSQSQAEWPHVCMNEQSQLITIESLITPGALNQNTGQLLTYGTSYNLGLAQHVSPNQAPSKNQNMEVYVGLGSDNNTYKELEACLAKKELLLIELDQVKKTELSLLNQLNYTTPSALISDNIKGDLINHDALTANPQPRPPLVIRESWRGGIQKFRNEKPDEIVLKDTSKGKEKFLTEESQQMSKKRKTNEDFDLSRTHTTNIQVHNQPSTIPSDQEALDLIHSFILRPTICNHLVNNQILNPLFLNLFHITTETQSTTAGINKMANHGTISVNVPQTEPVLLTTDNNGLITNDPFGGSEWRVGTFEAVAPQGSIHPLDGQLLDTYFCESNTR